MDTAKGEKQKYIVTQQPSFPGGESAMADFIRSRTEYPKKAQKEEIEGKVMVDFIVEKDGRLTDIEVSKSVHPLLDSQAVKVVRAMPDWEPGKERKVWSRSPPDPDTIKLEPVRVNTRVPIQFKLDQ